MRTAEIRQHLHNYIDAAEDKKLKAIYTLLENEIDGDYSLSPDQRNELDKRYANHQNGIGKTYNWDETVSIAKEVLGH